MTVYIFAETQKKAEIYKRFGEYKGARTFGNRSSYHGGFHFTAADEIYILPRVSYEIRKTLAMDIVKAPEKPFVHWVGNMEYRR